MMRILLVEDDTMISEALDFALRKEGYAVDCVAEGPQAVTASQLQSYDAVLLDLGLPQLDGLEVLRIIRQSGDKTPIIIVSARDAIATRIAGLDAGADDYVLKPIEMTELLARIRAVIRRKSGHASSLLENGSISLNQTTREVSMEGQPVRLSAREYALLEALLIRPGAILSRQVLEERIYQWDQEVESNAIEFLIHGLRKKLGAQAIRNVRGLGWMVSK